MDNKTRNLIVASPLLSKEDISTGSAKICKSNDGRRSSYPSRKANSKLDLMTRSEHDLCGRTKKDQHFKRSNLSLVGVLFRRESLLKKYSSKYPKENEDSEEDEVADDVSEDDISSFFKYYRQVSFLFKT